MVPTLRLKKGTLSRVCGGQTTDIQFKQNDITGTSHAKKVKRRRRRKAKILLFHGLLFRLVGGTLPKGAFARQYPINRSHLSLQHRHFSLEKPLTSFLSTSELQRLKLSCVVRCLFSVVPRDPSTASVHFQGPVVNISERPPLFFC